MKEKLNQRRFGALTKKKLSAHHKTVPSPYTTSYEETGHSGHIPSGNPITENIRGEENQTED